MSRRHVLK